MKTLRVVLCTMFTLAALGLVMLPHAAAKGPADKVTILGPGLDDPIEITEPKVAEALSMARLEDFNAPLDPPEILGTGYALSRFYKLENGSYQPFDHVVYYPDLYGGAGVVNYLGIVNGSTEYDGKWFQAHEEAEAVLREVLLEHDRLVPANLLPVMPYLVVTGDGGVLRLLDGETLEEAAALQLEGESVSVEGVMTALDGQRLYVVTTNEAGVSQVRVLNLGSARRNCFFTAGNRTVAAGWGRLVLETRDTLEIRGPETLELMATIPLPEGVGPTRAYFPSPDHRWLYVLVYDRGDATIYPLDLATLEFAPAISLETPPPDSLYTGQWEASSQRFHLFSGAAFYAIDARARQITLDRPFFRREGRTVDPSTLGGRLALAAARGGLLYLYQPEGPAGGIFTLTIQHGEEQSVWQPEAVFSTVFYASGHFYAEQDDSGELVALDASSGARVAWRSLQDGERLAGVVWLSPAAIETGPRVLSCEPGR